MSSKKLKIEVELDTAKAEKQAKDLESKGSTRSPSDVRSTASRSVKVPVEKPNPVKVPVEKPDKVKVPVEKPDKVKVPVEKPDKVKVPVEKPDNVKVPVEKPGSVKVPVEKPGSVKVPVEKPKPVKIHVGQPKPFVVRVRGEQPKPVKIRVVEPKPVKIKVHREKDGAEQTPASPQIPKSSENLSQSLDRASRSVTDFGEKSRASSSQIASVVRSFAGLGVSMAIGYAAKHMEPGAARTAVEATGGAIQGASIANAAVMAIPGAAQLKLALTALGAVAGGAKVLFDKSQEKKEAQQTFDKSEKTYRESREWNDKLRNLSEVEDSPVGLKKIDELNDQIKKLDEKIANAKEVAANLLDEQNDLIKRINEHIKKGETKQAEELQAQLATSRTRKEQTENLERAFARQKKSIERQIEEDKLNKKPDLRESLTATDALQKIGLGGPAAKAVASTVDSVSSTRSGRGFGFSVTERPYRETRFGNFEKPNNDFKIITPLESAERNGRMSLETLRNIYQVLQQKNGGVAWQ